MPETQRIIEQLMEDFIGNLRLDFFDDEEITAVLKDLDSLDKSIWRKAFALCNTLSHASSSVVPNTLKRISKAAVVLSAKDLDRWLSHAYDLLDREGIGGFIDFISHIDEEELKKFRLAGGLQFQEISLRLETFLRGISGLELRIAESREYCHTDTSTVYLPGSIDRYADSRRNFLLYKMMAVYAWAQTTLGSLVPDEETLRTLIKDPGIKHPDIRTLFRLFSEQDLAIDLYSIIEAIRLGPLIRNELPGLMRDFEKIKQDQLRDRPASSELSGKTGFVEKLYQAYLNDAVVCVLPEGYTAATAETPFPMEGFSWQEGIRTLFFLYAKAVSLEGDYRKIPSLFPLTIMPDAVSLQLKEKRRSRKQRIDAAISKLIAMPELEPHATTSRRGTEQNAAPEREKEYLLIKGRLLELDSELRETLEERGNIPGGILVKGTDIGTQGSPMTLSDLMEEAESEKDAAAGIAYDEWDYKRGGYKKKWCTLHKKTVHPGHVPFVEMTLKRYSGTINVLRKKFELLKMEPRLLRRQKEGDDIDIDAVIDAYADIRAGLSPSENLFTKYDRQERDIAALFLLDMSGSTKGWIQEAEKEALVLMAEALESLGDRYAIYGFSGMTRSKCDFYLIKAFDEPYAHMVKRRISGIAPKDYTRMGPPIRHSITLLRSAKARTKLLITLSDGKPEDYDSYKGDYGIEDTRKALIEAKEQGIHSFCITIDREAGSYLRHMYGKSNYVVIDDVRKLPQRITEIYRRLTT